MIYSRFAFIINSILTRFFFLSHVWINNSLFSIRIEISGKNVLILETQQNDQKSVGVINVKPENASIFFEYNPIYGFV